MKSYSEKLKDIRWQKKRLQVMERDGWKCRDCGAEGETLHVHHCHYEKGGPWETPDNLLMTLCADCHEVRQGLENDARRMLALITARHEGDDLGEFVLSLMRISRSPFCGSIHTHDEVVDAFESGRTSINMGAKNL